jgi:SAM-dependent methyltransferase
MEQGVYRLFSEIQTTHWWFIARRMIIEDLLKRYLKAGSHRIAEIGCGTGVMLRMLNQFGETWGIDNSEEALRICSEQNLEHLFLFDDPAWRNARFDGMAFFDVIEHVPDDTSFLRECLALLRPGGWAIITVPAFMFLWSEHDDLNRHYRRYTRAGLRKTIASAGLSLERISYFNTWLFPPIAIARFLTRARRSLLSAFTSDGTTSARTDFERNIAPLNGLLRRVFASERFVLRTASLPFGTSIVAIARKEGPVEPGSHLTAPR